VKKILGVFLIALAFTPSVFAKKVTLHYRGFPSSWQVSYQADNKSPEQINPPRGMWMTRTGYLSTEIEFNNKVVFSTKTPVTKMEVVDDGVVVELVELKNGAPAWGYEVKK
jgi:hypothetical protein